MVTFSVSESESIDISYSETSSCALILPTWI